MDSTEITPYPLSPIPKDMFHKSVSHKIIDLHKKRMIESVLILNDDKHPDKLQDEPLVRQKSQYKPSMYSLFNYFEI